MKCSDDIEDNVISTDLLEYRTVFVYDDIDMQMAQTLTAQLVQLDVEDDAPIGLLINTYGGEIYSAFALYDIIRGLRSPVYAVVTGAAFSAGTVILSACERRYILPNGTLLVHQARDHDMPSSQKAMDAECGARELTTLTQKMMRTYERHTRLSKAQIKRMVSKETFITAEDAVRYGFVDAMVMGLNIIMKPR